MTKLGMQRPDVRLEDERRARASGSGGEEQPVEKVVRVRRKMPADVGRARRKRAASVLTSDRDRDQEIAKVDEGEVEGLREVRRTWWKVF